ncbi:MAG: MFS transporter, partial [Bacteroidetes bacterium]|nr:MFS transporter [Bacteroidota bacterium]
MGILADRLGYKRFLVTGYFLCGVAGILYLLANSSSTLLIGRIVQGLGEAPLWALAPAVLSILNTEKKARTIGFYNASIHLGLTSGSLVGFIALKFFTESHICIVYISLCFFSSIWIILGVQEVRFVNGDVVDTPNHICKGGLYLLKEPSVLAVLIGIVIYGIGYGVYMTIIPIYISNVWQSGHDLSGLMFITFYIGITIAQFLGGPIADSVGRIIPMVSGLSLFSVGILVFFHTKAVLAISILTISSFGLGLFLVGSLTFLNDQGGRKSKGFVSGIFYFFWGSGYFLGPILLGYAGKLDWYEEGFTAIGLLGLVIVFLILITNKVPISYRGKSTELPGTSFYKK